MTTPILSVTDLSGRFGNLQAVNQVTFDAQQGISLTVGAGEVMGLFGRNGVGKTTMMKTIAGWVPPSSSELRFGGQVLTGLPSEQIFYLGIGFVPEDRRIFPGLAVEENLELGFMQAPGSYRAESRAKLDDIYQRFPRLAVRRRQMGTTLSGGERQMLAIARVLAGAPKLLLTGRFYLIERGQVAAEGRSNDEDSCAALLERVRV